MKPICFPCPRCETRLNIPAEKRRKVLICPDCGQSICLGPGYVRKADREQQGENKKTRLLLRRKRAAKAKRLQEF